MRASETHREIIRREVRRAMGTAARPERLHAAQVQASLAEAETLALPIDTTDATATSDLDAMPFTFDYSAFDGSDAWA